MRYQHLCIRVVLLLSSAILVTLGLTVKRTAWLLVHAVIIIPGTRVRPHAKPQIAIETLCR